MNKLKVCFLIAGFGQGGAQKQCILLMNELQNRDDLELHLIYAYEDVNFPDLEQKNIQLHKVKIASAYDPRNVIRIGKLLKTISPTIAFSWLQAFDVYLFFSRKFVPECKWIVAERDSHYPVDPRYILRKRLCVYANMIICNSDKGRLYWKENNVPNEKLSVVNNILSLKDGTSIDAIKGTPTVIFAGRFEVQKNVITIIQAFVELAKQYPQGRFMLIGNGRLQDKLDQILLESKMGDQISLLSFTTDIADYFETADVFVNVSWHEGLPNTVIENVSKNKIVVASEIAEHTDLLGSSYPYYVKNPDDVVEVCTVINSAIAGSKNVECLRYAQTKLADMTAQKVAENYMTLFKRVANV